MKKIFTLLSFTSAAFLANSQGLQLPYSTGFDNAAQQQGWQQFHEGPTSLYDWNVSGGGYSMPNALTHDYNVGAESTDTIMDWFVSPALNISLGGQITFKIRSSGFSPAAIDNCEIWLSSDNQNPLLSEFTFLANLSYTDVPNEWEDVTVNLPPISENTYLAFKYKTIGAAWRVYAIDNIEVTSSNSIGESEAVSSSDQLDIYPNPSLGETTFVAKVKNSASKIEIRNICGQLISTIQSKANSNLNYNAEGLESGVYLVTLYEGNRKLTTERLIVKK